jgi:PhnB protein
MKVSVHDIRQQYADLSDEGLLEMDRQDLVEVARMCYDEELARRGLKVRTPGRATPERAAAVARRAPEPSEPEPQAPEPLDDDEELAVAETYDSREAARLARELLRTNGIRARLGADGLEVLVPESTQEAAQAVLIAEISDETLASAAAPGDSWVRQGKGAVRPCLSGASGLIDFIQQVFGVYEVERFDLGPNLTRVDAAIYGYPVVLEVADRATAGAVPGSVYVYVRDVDAAYVRALKFGAEEIAPPQDMPYGERVAGVRDGFGNTWWMATYQA